MFVIFNEHQGNQRSSTKYGQELQEARKRTRVQATQGHEGQSENFPFYFNCKRRILEGLVPDILRMNLGLCGGKMTHHVLFNSSKLADLPFNSHKFFVIKI